MAECAEEEEKQRTEESKPGHNDEHAETRAGEMAPEYLGETERYKRGDPNGERNYAREKLSEIELESTNATENHGERGGANETEEILAADSQLTEAK